MLQRRMGNNFCLRICHRFGYHLAERRGSKTKRPHKQLKVGLTTAPQPLTCHPSFVDEI